MLLEPISPSSRGGWIMHGTNDRCARLDERLPLFRAHVRIFVFVMLAVCALLTATGALAAPSIQSLGVPAGFVDFTPTDVNSDGSVIVGTSQIPGDTFSFAARGFRWTAGGFEDLGSLGGDSVQPLRTSGQGDVVVGHANVVPGSVEFRIFRWTAATG